MFDSPGFALFVLAVLFFVGWYAVGTQYNVRLGSNALKWLQQGLKIVGEKATLRWLGSSVVELKIAKARDPFRTAEVLVAMEPRDVPVMWWWSRSRGRRDLLIFRAQLRAAPNFELEARRARAWADASPKRVDGNWNSLEANAAQELTAVFRGDISPATVKRLIGDVGRTGISITRFDIHRSVPNLEVHFLLPKFEQVAPPRVFTNLREVGEEILKN